MNKYLVTFALFGLIPVQPLVAQPEESSNQELQHFPLGGLPQDYVRDLALFDKEIADLLSSAPDDVTGKRSLWYPKLQAWKVSLDRAVSTGKQEDLFAMIPAMADFFYRDKTGEKLDGYLRSFEIQMYDCGYYLIMAAGAYIKQHDGKVDAATLSRFVKLFSVYGFDMEPDWENQTLPTGPADFMIINSTAIVKQLESEPWQQAQQFIGNRTPEQFFEAYTAHGEGLAALKSKYATQESSINTKFKQLVVWEWYQEQKSEKASRLRN